MAQDGAELIQDPFPLRDRPDQAPESSSLRVSSNTQLESGIPPAGSRDELWRERSEEHLELALAGVSRTEANLGQLLRGLKHLAAGATAARDANLELARELDELRAHLVVVNEEEAALRHRATQLEQLLHVVRHQAAREREFLIEQQDSFLVEIMSDQDRQIAELRGSLRDATGRRVEAHEREIAELTAQRDQAREYATRCERERDLAWQELAFGPAPHTSPSSEPRPPSKSGTATLGSISLKAVQTAAQIADTERQPTGYSLSRDEIK